MLNLHDAKLLLDGPTGATPWKLQRWRRQGNSEDGDATPSNSWPPLVAPAFLATTACRARRRPDKLRRNTSRRAMRNRGDDHEGLVSADQVQSAKAHRPLIAQAATAAITA
ncbi:hypothetical protein RNT82_12375, partial [Staphylococcus pseudintermedius]